MRDIFAIIVALALCGPAEAQLQYKPHYEQLSAGSMLPACKETPTERPLSIGRCMGQIEMLYLLAFSGGLSEDNKFCPPDRVSVVGFRDVIVKYIERQNLTAGPFFLIAIFALKNEWPCR